MSESSSHVHVAAPAPGRDTEVRLVTVERDVAGLKSDLGEIKSSMSTGFKELGEAMKSKGQPNWAALAIVAGLLVPALGWGWSQLGSIQAHGEAALTDAKLTFGQAIAKQEAALAAATVKQDAAAAAFMKREDIVALNASAKEIADLKMQIVQKDVTALGKAVDELQSKMVPLSTHQQLWKSQGDTDKTLLSAIDENRKRIDDISAPRDTIARMNKRLDDIEGIARGRGGRD